MRGARLGWLAILAGCSFPGNGQIDPTTDAPIVPPEVDAPLVPVPDAMPGAPDARPDATPPPPDAMPPPPPDAMPPPPPDAPPMASCPGYAPITGGFPLGATYRGVNSGATWSSARGDCENDPGNASLVVIDNVVEAQAVAALVNDPSSQFLWVGIFDPSGGGDNNWTTVRGGAPPYLEWGQQQPGGGNQDCVLLGDFPDWELYDYECGAPQVYVCECLP